MKTSDEIKKIYPGLSLSEMIVEIQMNKKCSITMLESYTDKNRELLEIKTSQKDSNIHFQKKINTLIEFPLKDLDLNKYINKEKDDGNKYIPEIKYDLFGVVNHYGSLEYGHYTSFCKNQHNNNWYEYNDRIVNEIPIEKEEETIVNPNAYILFYRQQKNDDIKWENIYNKKYEDINENNLKLFGQDFVYKEKEDEKLLSTLNAKNDKEIDKIDLNIGIDSDKKTDDNKEIILTNYERIKEEKNDDNFSFKEGGNNYIDNNENEKTTLNLELSDIQTPKFKDNNDLNRIEINNSIMGMIDFTESKKDNINESNKYQTEFKSKCNNNSSIYKGIIRTNKNIIRIKTYKKIRKNKNINLSYNNKEEEEKVGNIDNIDNKNNKSNSGNNELVQYNIFNKSKSYFKIELKKNIKSSYKSVKSKELTNFLLKEYSDDISDKVPRSKKLYNDSNLDTEAKMSNNTILNNEDETKEKKNEKNVIAIKEEESDSLKYVDKNEIDLEDYVYNPFRNCFAKLRKYGK